MAKIIGTGVYLPKKILSNADLEKLVETSDEWIVSRTGMKERRIAAEDEFTSDMGAKAAREAIKNAGLELDDIDLILCATLTPDYMFPSTACLIQHELGINCAATDMQAACSGFIYALSMAKAYIDSGIYKNVLIVASEKLSSITNYEDRGTCVLFGDGSTACVVSDAKAGLDVSEVCLGCDGGQADILSMPAGGVRKPTSIDTIANKEHYIHMEGRETFKHAVRRMEQACNDCLDRAKLKGEDVSWMIPHQANIRIIEFMAKRFNLPMERVYVTIHKYGNTSASSVGIALHELLQEKDIKEGERLLLTAFGAGLTWGSALLTKTGDT